jgi:His-Xaa-Ser system protein HxsD
MNRIDTHPTSFSICVDRRIYDDIVISKAIYWHTENFIIDRSRNADSETIIFHAKKHDFSKTDKENYIAKFNQELNDYKLRQIIEQETKNIRTILYIKAFSNNNDFEEHV